ncbi:3975_t:CDS:1, partial [Funneliformis caledonium]
KNHMTQLNPRPATEHLSSRGTQQGQEAYRVPSEKKCIARTTSIAKPYPQALDN